MRRPQILMFVLIVCLVPLVAACSPAVHATAKPTPTTPEEVAATKVAQSVIAQLRANDIPIEQTATYGPNTDPDHLLGRTSQYIGKIAFHDARVPSPTKLNALDVVDGGCVEVFANMADAIGAENYINQMNQTGALFFTEYDYFNGVILLRLSSQLPPSDAQAYKAVFMGMPKITKVTTTPTPQP